ncbi:MAG: hypothetical protein IPQ07_13765 [Myxococcales bacterium]|nr:hypothetical protein [Myxococcales bacterium]
MGARGLVLAMACALLGGVGCYSPQVDSCLYACNDGACPNGLTCNTAKMCATTRDTVCSALPVDASADADPAAPMVTFRQPSPQPNNMTGPRVTFAWMVAPDVPQTCELDGTNLGPCTSPATYQLPHGAHGFVVRATDKGHVGTARVDWLVNCKFSDGPGGVVLMHWDEASGQNLANELATPGNGYLGVSPGDNLNDPARVTAGRLGAGLDFGSSSTTNVATWDMTTSFNTSSFTLETWLFPVNTGTTTRVFTTGDDRITVDLDDGAVITRVVATLSQPVTGTDSQLTSVVTRNAWHHVVVTHDGSQHCLFVDGAQAGACHTAVVPVFPIRTLSWGSTIKTAGRMDEVFFGNQAWPKLYATDRFCPLP